MPPGRVQLAVPQGPDQLLPLTILVHLACSSHAGLVSAGLSPKFLTVVRDSLSATMHTDMSQKLVQGPVPLVTAWVASLICSVSAPSGATLVLKLHVWLSIGACSDALAISAPCNAAEDGQ